MPNYIDKDKLIRDLIDNRNFYPVIVKNAIENAPTEDVVPKSEMEKLQTVIFMKEDLTQKIAEERNQYGYEVVELKDKVEELQKQLEKEQERTEYFRKLATDRWFENNRLKRKIAELEKK